MGAWPHCGLRCRILHMYLWYTMYLAITTGPCRVSSRSTYPTVNSEQEVDPMSRCKPVCKITELQHESCRKKDSCTGKLSCRSDSECMLQCSNKHVNITAWLSLTAECDTDDTCRPEGNTLTCDPLPSNESSLQFEKPNCIPWSIIFSMLPFDVTCYPVPTKCPSMWNCKITNVTITKSTTSSTTTSNTKSTLRPTTPPSTSTTRTTPPSTSTTRTTPPSTSTTKTTPPSTSTTKTTPPGSSEKRTSPLKTPTTYSLSPWVSTSTTSTQTATEGGSTASQTDSNPVPTIAVAVGSMLVLSIVVISIIVIIVLRRNRSRRKKTENPVFIVNNIAYGAVTKPPKNPPEADNHKSSSDIPAKPEADEEHSYCYASFDDSQQTVNPEVQHVEDPNPAMTSLDDSYFVLEKDSNQHGHSNKMNQSEYFGEKETAHKVNKWENPSNYFVLDNLESVYDTERPEADVSSNYFVLDTTSNEHKHCATGTHEAEITDTDGKCSGNADDNYFLVGTTADDRQASTVSSEHSTAGHHDHVSNDNYFVLDKTTDNLKVVKDNETYSSPVRQNNNNPESIVKPGTIGTPTAIHDPYDHVRIGHVQTNGYDDGVYDELRKQHVRYDADDVENEYDHC